MNFHGPHGADRAQAVGLPAGRPAAAAGVRRRAAGGRRRTGEWTVLEIRPVTLLYTYSLYCLRNKLSNTIQEIYRIGQTYIFILSLHASRSRD